MWLTRKLTYLKFHKYKITESFINSRNLTFYVPSLITSNLKSATFAQLTAYLSQLCHVDDTEVLEISIIFLGFLLISDIGRSMLHHRKSSLALTPEEEPLDINVRTFKFS